MKTIGSEAFYGCTSLASVSIPGKVKSIENYAFYECSNLITVTIPSSVTSIGHYAFAGCNSLTSVYISDIEAWCKISFDFGEYNNPLSFAHHLYLGKDEVRDLVIPNSITSIGYNAFNGCSSLTSVSIPNSVTSIGDFAFSGCSGLSFVTIPNSVTSIGEGAFSGCSEAKNIILAENLQIIKKSTFSYCSSLTNITIPASVEFIYQEAFSGCNSLTEIKALPTAPPFVYNNTFSNFSATLKVPEEGKDAYSAHDVWSKFEKIQTLTGEDVNPEKCATPTIKYIGGKLLFECETEDVEFVYSITTPANTTNQTGNNVDMPHTNTVSVYAKKEGYLNSEVATENIDVRGLKGDVNTDGEVNVGDIVTVCNIMAGKDE